jgi:Zn-dependent M32 family carboxypeptidase
LSNIDLLYKREALKIEILADRPKIFEFIKNSYQLWMGAQWRTETPHDVFHGSGGMVDVLGRQLARKSCLNKWRAVKAGQTPAVDLIEPMTTILNYTRRIARNLQDYTSSNTPYDALVEFQTPGFINLLTEKDIDTLRQLVKSQQTDDEEGDHPPVPLEVQDKIIAAMIDLARLDMNKVEIINDIAHPACLGYGGRPFGVKLGITHDPKMTPFKSLLTNWHEVGHAAYRQHIPYGSFVAGRAMDEAMAFLFEYWIGYSDDFLQMMLEEGLSGCGYDIGMLKSYTREIVRNTKRIETNPVRHIIDIHLCDELERALVNEDIDAGDVEPFWTRLIEPYADILPDDYPYYYDVHMMSGIYGDRACYNPGMLAAMQIGESRGVTLDNLTDVVKTISESGHDRFDEAVNDITGQKLSAKAYMDWVDKVFN